LGNEIRERIHHADGKLAQGGVTAPSDEIERTLVDFLMDMAKIEHTEGDVSGQKGTEIVPGDISIPSSVEEGTGPQNA
jgi:hypothetical protein